MIYPPYPARAARTPDQAPIRLSSFPLQVAASCAIPVDSFPMHGPEDVGTTIRTRKYYRPVSRHELCPFIRVKFIDALLGGSLGRLAETLFSEIGWFPLLPIPSIAVALLYYGCRVSQEEFDLEMLAETLGAPRNLWGMLDLRAGYTPMVRNGEQVTGWS